MLCIGTLDSVALTHQNASDLDKHKILLIDKDSIFHIFYLQLYLDFFLVSDFERLISILNAKL